MAFGFFVSSVLVSERRGHKMETAWRNKKSFYHTSTIYHIVNLTNRDDFLFRTIFMLYIALDCHTCWKLELRPVFVCCGWNVMPCISVWFEPTDISHVRKLFASDAWKRLTCSSPNMNELRMLHQNLHGRNHSVDKGKNKKHIIFIDCLANRLGRQLPAPCETS